MDFQALTLFIVDDDPSSRMVSAYACENPAYRVVECDSGEACLAALDERKPDIVLLDVEMPGMDGIATCRALRAAGLREAQVIFVSIHNDLETRLKAYDAGGDDYLVKPCAPEEIAKKVAHARLWLEERRSLARQAAQATQTAFAAMSSMGDLGIVLQFLRASFACASPEALAREIFAALGQYDLAAVLEMRLADRRIACADRGACTPLEASILQHAQGMDRVFQFRDRIAINYPCITLLVSRMPVADAERAGRLRDNLAILAEGANARLAALESELARKGQAEGIRAALADLSAALDAIEAQQARRHLSVLDEINRHVMELERSFVHLGLSQPQEETLSTMARVTAANVGDLLGEIKEVSDLLHGVAGRLRQLTAQA